LTDHARAGRTLTPRYEHTQLGRALLVIVGGATVAVMAGAVVIGEAAPGARLVMLVLSAVLAVCLYLFSSMTIVVTGADVDLVMLHGLLHRRYALPEITEVLVVRDPWWYGWGIHGYPGGVLYNVSGSFAVELRLHDRRSVRLGSDEPEKLLAAVEAARAAAAGEETD
jgi:hypothetical protein